MFCVPFLSNLINCFLLFKSLSLKRFKIVYFEVYISLKSFMLFFTSFSNSIMRSGIYHIGYIFIWLFLYEKDQVLWSFIVKINDIFSVVFAFRKLFSCRQGRERQWQRVRRLQRLRDHQVALQQREEPRYGRQRLQWRDATLVICSSQSSLQTPLGEYFQC